MAYYNNVIHVAWVGYVPGKLGDIYYSRSTNGGSTWSAPWLEAEEVHAVLFSPRYATDGTLYVQRPGRLRFEYARPATLEIIADGTSVAVRDRKLATQDVYFIGQTPLKFLLKERIGAFFLKEKTSVS